MTTEVCVLDDGRRVKYRLDKRKTSASYYVYFEGPDGKRHEISTKEPNQKRARESAVAVIIQEFQPRVYYQDIGWDEAVEMMAEHMRGRNLRPNTVETYKYAIRAFRNAFPKVNGPGAVTVDMAKRYKLERLKTCVPETVKGDLNELNTVFGKWFVAECGILGANPFEGVEPPKVDKREPRLIERTERDALMGWLAARWDNWRLPLLFLEVKASIGCRIGELASVPSDRLKDGRLTFEAVSAKGRKTRRSKLAPVLFDELSAVAGPNFVFERFPDELRDLLLRRGRPHQARRVKFPFDPSCLVNWMQDRLADFRKAHPEIPRFKLHNFRGTAMSRAMEAGANYNEASIAFGCHPETMRKNYLKFEETAISDGVMDLIRDND